MIPSREWNTARGQAPRLFRPQCRNLSSASRRIQVSRPSLRSTFASPSTAKFAPLALSTPYALRFASTAPPAASASPAPEASAPSPVSESEISSNLDTINLENLEAERIAAIPEGMGYLKEIGLDYGWGPSAMLEFAVECFHVYGGLPWWGAIAGTAMFMRIIMLPMFIKMSDAQARQAAMGSITKPINDEITRATRTGDQALALTKYRELSQIKKRAGLSWKNTFLPLVLQGLFGYCGFKLTRMMAALPVPALHTDGFLWVQDLTLADPYLLLPVAMASTMHLTMRLGGETGAAEMPKATKNLMMYGVPVITLVFMGNQAAIVNIWFMTTGSMSILQSLAFQRPAVREFLGIAPLYKPSAEERNNSAMNDAFQRTQERMGEWFGVSSEAQEKYGSHYAATGNSTKGEYQPPHPNQRGGKPKGRTIDVQQVNKKAASSRNSAPKPSADNTGRPKARKNGKKDSHVSPEQSTSASETSAKGASSKGVHPRQRKQQSRGKQ